MQIYKNAIDDQTLNELTEYYNLHPADHFTPWRNAQGVPNDFRCIIENHTEMYKKMSRVVEKYFPNYDPNDIYMAYQRQYNPTRLHVDPFGTDAKNKKYTMVIPILTDERLKTFVFKNKFNSNEYWTEAFDDWFTTKRENSNLKLNNLSIIEDFEHTKDEKSEDYIVDYLDIDGIFKYIRSDIVIFECQQVHCASNWLKYPEYESKDIMQIHISDLSAKI